MINVQKIFEHIDRYADVITRDTCIPGMSIAVTDRDKTLGMYTRGFSDLSAKTPVTSDSLFEIASIGKSFTAIITLQLYDEGKLDLYTPVEKYLPWFYVDSEYPPITLHHLLGHTAGIIRGTEQAPYGLYDAWALRETKTGFFPGEHWHYSSIGYKVLGFLLERLTGQTLKELIQSRILDPLGMTVTYPVIDFETRKHTTVGYSSLYDDRPECTDHELVPALWNEYSTGDGCQVSTAEDMAIFVRMLINRGTGPDGRLITEESFYRMAPLAQRTESEQYGYALVSYPVDGHVFLGHGGGNAGFSSHILADVDEGIGVVVLTNRRTESEAVYRIAEYILKALYAVSTGVEVQLLPQAYQSISLDTAVDYTGTYKSDSGVLKITMDNGRLFLDYEGRAIPLEYREKDNFYIKHPDFDIFLLEFKRDRETVTEAFYGSRWYTNDRYTGPMLFNYPEEWMAYTGHYRTRNPELSNFRVLLRKGTLVLIYPSGNVEPLIPAGDGLFKIGNEHRSPETLRFDAIVEGQAFRAIYSGCPYFRTFTL